MSTRWFYAHGGRTQGPLSVAQLKERAVAGLLQPQDLVWPEGASKEGAVEAGAALDWAALVAPAPVLPDWLGDLRQEEQHGPQQPTPPSSHQVPDWLQDVQQAEETPERLARGVELAGPLIAPDWLEDVRNNETPLEAIPDTTIPLAMPVPSSPASRTDNLEEVAAHLLLDEEVPVARAVPIAPAVPRSPPPTAPPPEDTGFDPETGRVLDPVKQEQWLRKQQRQRQQELAAQPGESFDMAFQRGRRDAQKWVDAEENEALVLHGDRPALERDARLREVLQRYQGHGPELTNKLWQYLEFLIENRRKHSAARRRTGG